MLRIFIRMFETFECARSDTACLRRALRHSYTMNFNKAIILGRLTNDPDQRTLPSGQPVVNFSVATNRVYTVQDGNKQEFVEFHNIVAFGKLADICTRYLKKG